MNFGSKNFHKFIPQQPEIEIQPKIKFLSLLIDLDVFVDTTCCYEQTWAKEFVTFISQVHEQGHRMLSLEIGDSFSVGLTEEREVYSWGLNDQNQCGKETDSFTCSVQNVKNLSCNGAKVISLGKDHGVMLSDNG